MNSTLQIILLSGSLLINLKEPFTKNGFFIIFDFMRESKKDKREHDYGKVHRFARHIHNDPNIKSYDVKSDLIDELYEKLHVDEKLDYVEFCRYLRHIGVNNHGRANIKHDRDRRTLGIRKMIQNKKRKEFEKADRREKVDEE